MPDSDSHGGIFEVEGIGKAYGNVEVLRGVNFTLAPGSVLAIFGENGAGKSTLMKIVGGSIRSDGGKMTLDGAPYAPKSPLDALQRRVAVITQELSLCPDLTAAENIVLGAWPGRFRVSFKHAAQRAAELIADGGVNVPLHRPVRDLSLGQRQLVEILKAVNRRPQILVLDEPTAALPSTDARRVLDFARSLVERGVSLILVSHRLSEALDIATHCLVLRSGSMTLSSEAATTSAPDVVQAMLGRQVGQKHRTRPTTVAQRTEVLRLTNWQKSATPGLRSISLRVVTGEIVGIYGSIGSGTDELASALAGTAPIDSGQTTVLGRRMAKSFRSPRKRVESGLLFVPGDRTELGLALMQSITTNLMFPPTNSKVPLARFVIGKKQEALEASELTSRYLVTCKDASQPVGTLSGGNQQKILVASRTAKSTAEPTVIVLHEPTRGVDIGSREGIHESIRSAALEGAGVLVITSDVDELAEVADRVLVLRLGSIVAEIEAGADLAERVLRSNDVANDVEEPAGATGAKAVSL